MFFLEPLGDQAVLAHFENEDLAANFAQVVRRHARAWVIDVVQAYITVAVFFDAEQIRFADAAAELKQIESGADKTEANPALHHIPCCYDLALDMERVTQHTGLARDEVIRCHTSTEYTVYAIGFCPGFPYLGYLPPALQGVPRLDAPRTRVEPGSVGMTGKQTGIYTEARPGGWNIIGRTPLELVGVRDGYFPIRTGDRVVFHAIDESEYRTFLGKRLA